MLRNKAGQEAEDKATVMAWVAVRATARAWVAEGREVARIAHRVMLAEGVDKVGVAARATAEAWVVEGREVARIAHRVMLAEDVDKVGVAARATAEAWVVEGREVARTAHRAMLAEDVDKVGVAARATDRAWVAVKAKALAEDRVVVGIATAKQTALVLIVSQAKAVTEAEAWVNHIHWCLTVYGSIVAV